MGKGNSNSNYYDPIWHRSQCFEVKWGARVLRVRSVSREEVWASAGVQSAWVGGCGELELELIQSHMAQKHIMNYFQHIPESCGAWHNPCGGAPQQRGPLTPQTQTRPNRLHTHTHPPKRLAHPRSPIPPLSTLTSRATHAHPTSPRSTGFCVIWGCISSSSKPVLRGEVGCAVGEGGVGALGRSKHIIWSNYLPLFLSPVAPVGTI